MAEPNELDLGAISLNQLEEDEREVNIVPTIDLGAVPLAPSPLSFTGEAGSVSEQLPTEVPAGVIAEPDGLRTTTILEKSLTALTLLDRSFADVSEVTQFVASGVVGFMAGGAAAGIMSPINALRSIYTDSDETFIDMTEDAFLKAQGWVTHIPETERAQLWTNTVVENTFGKVEEAGEYLGELVQEDTRERIQAGEKLTQGKIEERAMFASALRTLPDAILMIAPIKLIQAGKAGKIKLQEKGILPHKEPGLVDATMAFDDLAKMKGGTTGIDNVRLAEIANDVRDIATGKLKPTVTVLRVDGVPTEIIGGQAALIAMERLNTSGSARIADVPIKFIDEVGPPIPGEAVAAQRAFDRMEGLREMGPGETRQAVQSLTKELIEETVQPGYVAEKALFNLMSEEAVAAIDLKNLQAGASGRSKIRAIDAWDGIYKGLRSMFQNKVIARDGSELSMTHRGKEKSITRKEMLDILISSKRDIILGRLAEGIENANKTVKDIVNRGRGSLALYRDMQRKIDLREFADFEARTNVFFETILKNAERLKEEGIITDDAFRDIQHGSYMTSDFARRVIDSETTAAFEKGSKSTLKSPSGVRPSSNKAIEKFESDSELLLTDAIYRTEARIGRNRANLALAEVLVDATRKEPLVEIGFKAAKKIEEDGKIVFQKPNKNQVAIKYWEKGIEERLIVDKQFGESWNRSGQENLSIALNAIRSLTGTQLVKMTATGLNPGFAPVTLAMDIIHGYVATANLYNRAAPIYLGQIGADLATTARDAFTRQGRYREFLEDGGAPDFRTTQGYMPQTAFSSDATIAQAKLMNRIVNPRISRVRHALGYAGETAEVWVRLAIRERAMRNMQKQGLQPDRIHASAVARAMLDYSKSGRTVRVLDSISPYFSAGTQAIKTFLAPATRIKLKTNVKGVREESSVISSDAAEWAGKIAQAGAAFGAWEAYLWMNHREARESMGNVQARKFLNVPLGMSLIDERGVERHMFVKLKKDPSIIPFTMGIESTVQRLMTGVAPSQPEMRMMMEAIPIPLAEAIPIARAWQQYMSNEDFWKDDAIWKGRAGIDPSVEAGENTHPIMQAIGSLTDTSPKRLQVAFDTLVADNSYLKLGDMGMMALMEAIDNDPNLRTMWDRKGAEFWREFPMARRALYLSHPIQGIMERRGDGITEEGSALQSFDNTLSILIRREGRGENVDNDLNALYEQVDERFGPLERKTLLNKYWTARISRTVINTDPTLQRLGYDASYWIQLSNVKDPQVRAEYMFEDWKVEDIEDRQRMYNMAIKLSGKTSFMDGKFIMTWQRLKAERGTDLPLTIEEYEDARRLIWGEEP